MCPSPRSVPIQLQTSSVRSVTARIRNSGLRPRRDSSDDPVQPTNFSEYNGGSPARTELQETRNSFFFPTTDGFPVPRTELLNKC